MPQGRLKGDSGCLKGASRVTQDSLVLDMNLHLTDMVDDRLTPNLRLADSALIIDLHLTYTPLIDYSRLTLALS